MVDLAVKLDIIQKSGSWFSMGELRIGQGRDAARQYLKDNPDVAEKVEAEVRANAYKLMGVKSGKGDKPEKKSAGQAVDVSADDFMDGPVDED